MPAGDSTLVSLPPHPSCLVRGASENDGYTSTWLPHLAQRYSYVGIVSPPRRSRSVGRETMARSYWHSRYESAKRSRAGNIPVQSPTSSAAPLLTGQNGGG